MHNQEEKTVQSNTRESILNAASRLITEKGIDNTSLSDIAKFCGISKGTLYYYYSSKSDLVYDVAELHMQRITGRIYVWLEDNRSKASLTETIEMVLDIFLGAETREKLHLYLIHEAMTNNDKLKQQFVLKYQEWRTIVEAELGKILKEKACDSETLAYIIVAAIDGFVIQSIFDGQRIPVRKIAEYLTKGI